MPAWGKIIRYNNLDELIQRLIPSLPEAEVAEDNDGQIIIHTNLRVDGRTGEICTMQEDEQAPPPEKQWIDAVADTNI